MAEDAAEAGGVVLAAEAVEALAAAQAAWAAPGAEAVDQAEVLVAGSEADLAVQTAAEAGPADVEALAAGLAVVFS